MTGVEALKPSAFVALCDGETPKNCPAKRVAKSLNKTVENFDDTLVVMSRIETSAAVFAAIEGGFDSKMRRMSAEKMSKRSFILFIQKIMANLHLFLSILFILQTSIGLLNSLLIKLWLLGMQGIG